MARPYALVLASCLTLGAASPAAAPAAGQGPHVISASRPQMATGVRLIVYGEDDAKAQEAFEAAFAELARIEQLMSEWVPGSDITRLNEAAGGDAIVVSPETFLVLERGKALFEATRGAFAVTWAALASVWDFSPAGQGPRQAPEVAKVLERVKLVGDQDLILDAEAHSARLARVGMKVGLGAIAKGYGIDRALAVLGEHGYPNALVFAGGDIASRGTKGEEPWRVGLQDPRGEGYFAMLALQDRAIATSGDYESFFEVDGVRYHHLLDPRTGFPARGTRSVSIVTKDAMSADALATAVFVLGPQDGMAFVESQPDVEAVIVDEQDQVLVSSGLRGDLVTLRPPTP